MQKTDIFVNLKGYQEIMGLLEIKGLEMPTQSDCG